jgi:hypothetical protein
MPQVPVLVSTQKPENFFYRQVAKPTKELVRRFRQLTQIKTSVIQSCNFAHGRQRFGLRWQSAAATPLSVLPVASKSGVAPALRIRVNLSFRVFGGSSGVFCGGHSGSDRGFD